MGKRIRRSFFEADEVLFVGYSKRHESFCKMVADAFAKRGTKVHPVNPEPGKFDIPVFPTVGAIPGKPKLAFVMTGKQRNAELVEVLAAHGVERVAFMSAQSADAALLARCADLGMEAAVACPMMALGGGLHRFHGFLAGVRG